MSSAKKIVNISTSDGTKNNEFLELAEKIADFAKMAGAEVIPYDSPSLPHFSKLNSQAQESVIRQLQSKVSSLEAAHREGMSFRSNKQMLWHFLKEMKLRPTSDVLNKIKDEDVIEIHWVNDGIVQAYHSFNFYNKSSYSLEQLCSYTWQELYSTDLSTVESIVRIANGVYSGEIAGDFDPEIPSYVVEELRSAENYKVYIDYKMISPLHNKSGEPVAALSVESLRVLDKESLKEAPQDLPNPSLV